MKTIAKNSTVTDPSTQVFSCDFIAGSISRYLRENGYRVEKEIVKNISGKHQQLIIASKYFQKEVIEVKGYQNTQSVNDLNALDKPNGIYQVKQWFTEALFNSFVNFGRYYSNDNVWVSMALPDIDRSKAIIEKVKDYFTLNDLYFKIYMVNANREVEILNLNEKYANK
jgi:isocitrate lyase